ncbi:MAG: cytochrome b/b6 domain-containing protein [Actinomycetota bacterium]|nr:cytochrome b/b6 domain-containing protein [Actinomycetota bacterium]
MAGGSAGGSSPTGLDQSPSGGEVRTAGRRPSLLRFDRVERVVHWLNASLFATLVITGAALYLAPLEALIGRRELVERVHVYAGLALPLPVLVALSGSWGKGLRADLARVNRWGPEDRRWARAVLRGGSRRGADAACRLGKFNPGQKLNAAFTAGAGLVMLATGCLLRWYRPFPLSWRMGATFVHNWLAVVFVLVVAGHVALAVSDRDSMGSMLTGRIGSSWASEHAPAWLAELTDAAGPDGGDRAWRPEAPRGGSADPG